MSFLWMNDIAKYRHPPRKWGDDDEKMEGWENMRIFSCHCEHSEAIQKNI